MVVAAGEQSDENESTLGQLDGRVRENICRSVDCGVVAVYATIGILRGMLAVP